MIRPLLSLAFSLFVLGILAPTVRCQAVAPAKQAGTPAQQNPADGKDTLVETTHSIMLGGKKLDYRARAGTLILKDENDKPTASIFYVAYTRSGVPDVSTRPVTFAFNGGPGSSAVWLHLGCLGPRRIDTGDNADNAPPYRITDNEATLLDQTDLVFIDPVSTGFSRAIPGSTAGRFHGVQSDVQSVASFIRLYVTRNNRWNSPKFLIGESYGTTRASGLAAHLQDQLGINLNGIVLVSPALNFQTIIFDSGNELPFIVYLPGYTATAWYHKKLPPDLQGDFRKAVDDARRFAQGEYTLALMNAAPLPEARRRELARKVAHYTGLEEEVVLRHNLRVELPTFMTELLRKERKIVGRFDSRYVGPANEGSAGALTGDPSYAAVDGPFTAAFNEYLRHELKYECDLPYEILNLRVQPWDFGDAKNRFLNVSESLRHAMETNPQLRVLVVTGYYDLATPFLSTDWTVGHLHLDPTAAERIATRYYAAGHMMYLHGESRRQLKADLDRFYQEVRSQPAAR